MWTRSTALGLLFTSALFGLCQTASAQNRRVGKIDPVTVQPPRKRVTRPIVRDVAPVTTIVTQPRGRLTLPSNRPMPEIEVVRNPVRLVPPSRETVKPVRQDKLRIGRVPRTLLRSLAATPAAGVSAPRKPSPDNPRSEFLPPARSLPQVGDSRAEVLRAMGSPAASVSRSDGQETLVFDDATVLLQHGVVADIY